MSDDEYLVCPGCGRAERAAERTACPDCGSDRTYLSPEPALPDATSEAYVKLDADEAAAGPAATDQVAQGSEAEGSDAEGEADDAGTSDREG